MTSETAGTGGSWRTMTWTLLAGILVAIVAISAVPWIVRKATIYIFASSSAP